MDKQYYLGIGLGISFLLVAIIVFVVLYFFIKNKMRKKELIKKEHNFELMQFIKNVAAENNTIFLDKTNLKYDKNKNIILNGPLLISNEAIILTHPLYTEEVIDGNCIEREWYKQSKKDSKQKIFPNPILSEDQVIKNLLNILPKKIPIIVLFILLNEEIENDIYNIPGHVLFYKKSKVSEAFSLIKNELDSSLGDELKLKLAKKIQSLSMK